jgi:tight adherence protein B
MVLQLFILLNSTLLGFAVMQGANRFAPLGDELAAKYAGRHKTAFEQLSMDNGCLRWFLRVWWIVLPGAVCLVLFGFGKLPLACLAAFLLYRLPRLVLEIIVRRRKRLLSHQLSVAATGMANCLKAGLSLPQGLEAVAHETPMPLAAVLHRIIFEYQRGRPLQEGMEIVRQRLNLEAFTLFALTIQVALERGGRVNESLQRIAASLRENERLQRKIEADTSAGRQVVFLLAIFPAAFLGFFYLLDPHSVGLLFDSFLGQIFLVAAYLMVFMGYRWASKIIHIEM